MVQYTKYFDNCMAVFQGGGCKVIADIGAYEYAINHGVIINELAGTSAGSILAAMIAANATIDDLKGFVEKFAQQYKTLLVAPTQSWKDQILIGAINLFFKPDGIAKKIVSKLSINEINSHLGLYDMAPLHDFIDTELRKVLGLNAEVRFSDIPKPLYIVATDLNNGDVKCWSTRNTPNEPVANAICSSCAIPLFFHAQGQNGEYVDGGLLSNSPMFVFDDKLNYNKILNFCFEKKTNMWHDSVEHLSALVSTVIDGAVAIQHQVGIEKCDITITPPTDIETTSFDRLDSQHIGKLYKAGEDAMKELLKAEEKYSPLNHNRDNLLTTYDQLYSLVASFPFEKISDVYVSMYDTHWCWRLFPTLLRWIEKGVNVKVFAAQEYSEGTREFDDEKARHRLLSAFGINVETSPREEFPLSGFFLNMNNSWYGIVVVEDTQKKTLEGKYYDHPVDHAAIKAYIEKLNRTFAKNEGNSVQQFYNIQQIQPQIFFDQLKNVDGYQNATMTFTSNIPVDKLRFLSPHIRLEKFRQIDKMFNLYQNNKWIAYSAACIVLPNKKQSLIGPIVIEKHGEDYYVIEGNTRLARAYYKKQMDKIEVLMVENVSQPLPSDEPIKSWTIDQLRVTDAKSNDNLSKSALFRHIEAALRPSKTYLL